jgi:hypothetical protein
MTNLVMFFLELLQLRRTPADLPVSNALFALLFSINCALGALAHSMFVTSDSLLRTLAGEVLMLVMLALLFWLKRAQPRFLQSAIAATGASAVMFCMAIVIGAIYQSTGTSLGPVLTGFFGLMLLTLIFWFVAVLAHILKAALVLPLWQATLIALAMYSLQVSLARGLSVPGVG